MRLALYQPDIPQNAGAMIRLAACLGVGLDIIEPCGFTFTDRQLKRAAMDYAPLAEVQRHPSWDAFSRTRAGRLVLLTTAGRIAYTEAAYAAGDVLLVGRESAGVPDTVHAAADLAVRVPMRDGARSLNVTLAAGMVLGEALRQTGGFAELV